MMIGFIVRLYIMCCLSDIYFTWWLLSFPLHLGSIMQTYPHLMTLFEAEVVTLVKYEDVLF